MEFKKMHGAGNDFIVINNMDLSYQLSSPFIRSLCEKHYGIGSDGFIALEPSETMDIKMRYYNNDGNEAEMCGNGVRCLAKFAVDERILNKERFQVETLAGKIDINMIESKEYQSSIEVSMGKIRFETEKIPVISEEPFLIDSWVSYGEERLNFGCATMGNPHMMILVDDLETFLIEEVGAYFETHPMFPEKCNINFAQIIDFNNIKLRTWERGVGLTEACGTGACATVGVLHKRGGVASRVKVILPRGELTIEINKDDVFMTGTATNVFKGEINLNNLN
ncbi:MAG: diaminopimelate epimerase [Eubacteriaceae bacterium]